MRRTDSNLVLGLLLVVAGALLLLQNFGVMPNAWEALWAMVFGVGGLAFLGMFLRNRAVWWPVIPGFTLLGLSAVISYETFLPWFPDEWAGALFLGMIGLSFWAIYASHPVHWWAVIPGGVLLTLALVAGMSGADGGPETGGVFFLGLGLTFALIYLLPTPRGRMSWPAVPAIILCALGVLIITASSEVFEYLWPVALILGGLFWIYQSTRRRAEVRPAPATDSDGEKLQVGTDATP